MNNFTFIPTYAVHDPRVTFTLPPHLTASTGMDTLTHAVESYIGQSTTPQTRRLSEEAVKLVRGEIRHMIRHTRRYAREKTVYTPLSQFPSRSYRKPCPFFFDDVWIHCVGLCTRELSVGGRRVTIRNRQLPN